MLVGMPDLHQGKEPLVKGEARYASPLGTRYAGEEMARLWSDIEKFRLWRKLWVALAEAEMELGIPISRDQVEALRRHIEDVDVELAEKIEREVVHDVMAHIKTFGAQVPSAAGIIHLGATSYDIVDNADLVRIREGLRIVLGKLLAVIRVLCGFARKWSETATIGYTHLQKAQPTTVGKRACLWINDFLVDLNQLGPLAENIPFRGAKGATGTQGSYVQLFDGSTEKAKKLDKLYAEKMGFETVMPITCQIYSRRVDATVLSALSGVGQSSSKLANDVRLLQGLGELSEPFGRGQIGSSAMAYKRNPIKSERVCSLARHAVALAGEAAATASVQWLERSLDDSACRRIYLPEAFLTADAILNLVGQIASGLQVREDIVRKHLEEELPFSATEPILMAAVKRGGDRQEVHERIRVHAMEAHKRVAAGQSNDLLERLKADEVFSSVRDDMEELSSAERLVGRAPEQVEEFVAEVVEPELKRYGKYEREIEAPRV